MERQQPHEFDAAIRSLARGKTAVLGLAASGSMSRLRAGCLDAGLISRFVVSLIAAATVASPIARGASADWRGTAYDYIVINQDLTEVLKNFGYNTGLRMSIAPGVKGTVHGRIDADTAGAFLDTVTKANALDWYYDGSVMYVSPASDEQTEAVPLHGASFEAIKANLSRAGLIDARYGLAEQRSNDLVIISGPLSYVSVIKQAIEVETAKAGPAEPPDQVLVVYRGAQSVSMKVP